MVPDWTNRSLCGDTCLSLVETLILTAEATGDESLVQSGGQPFFGQATHFVSYTWSAVFFDLFETIATQCEKSGVDVEKTFFWIDIFAVNQAVHTVLTAGCCFYSATVY